MAFRTKNDLIAWLEKNGFEKLSNGDWFQSGTYYLRHGEYSQPDFSVRRYKDGWSLHGNFYFFGGTFNATKCGRVSEEFFWGPPLDWSEMI